MFDEKARVVPSTPAVRTLDATNALSRWAMLVVVLYLLLGTIALASSEDWVARDALYFCVTLLTTVGYGDISPKSNFAKGFCCVYVICGVLAISSSLGGVMGKMQARINMDRVLSSGMPGQTRRLVSATASMVGIVLLGAIFVYISEGWSALDSLYWAVITCTSVGLGDLPISSSSRTFSSMYLLVAVGTFAASTASIVHVFADLEVQRSVSSFVAGGVSSSSPLSFLPMA